MLAKRQRLWTNFEPTLVHWLVLAAWERRSDDYVQSSIIRIFLNVGRERSFLYSIHPYELGENITPGSGVELGNLQQPYCVP